jgi:hypothetical protein
MIQGRRGESPKRKIRAQVKMERRLQRRSDGAGSIGVADVRSVRLRSGQKRSSAKIYVARARTDFYNPVSILIQQIHDSVEEEVMTSEVREVDPRGVSAIAPDDSGFSHSTGRGKLWPLALRRLRSIVGGEHFARAWRADCVPAGYFFLFADRLLLVSHEHQGGWSHAVVPPEGVAQDHRRSPCPT